MEKSRDNNRAADEPNPSVDLGSNRAGGLPHIMRHPLTPKDALPLLAAIERKDMATAAHTWRVILYTRALCEARGLERDIIERITVAAALHDIGKIDTPDEILKKPGDLTADEFEIIKLHTVHGHRRLVEMGVDDPILLNLVRHHHERIDGSGYPDGLKGRDIPVGPRYFSVIDAFDAMTSVRPYRLEIGESAAQRALAELQTHAGVWYCDEAVELFESVFRKGGIDWVLHYFNDTCPVPPIDA